VEEQVELLEEENINFLSMDSEEREFGSWSLRLPHSTLREVL